MRRIAETTAVASSDGAATTSAKGSVLLPVLSLAWTLSYLVLKWREFTLAHAIGMTALTILAIPLVWRTFKAALKGDFATDAIASMSLIGSVLLGQPLPGLIIVVMQSGGEWVERLAQRRASQALAQLESRAPRIAHRRSGGALEDVDVAKVVPGDVLLVRGGEVIPVDGVVSSGRSEVDTSTLTGEPLARSIVSGSSVSSGFVNGSSTFEMKAERVAARSQYALIVELVRGAQAHKAPLQRIADRYAARFTPFVVITCALVFAVTSDWMRVLAVLVVATPCPLILAAPIAFMGGINVGARRNIIFRSGSALEQLANARAIVFDKTGTLTTGSPQVVSVEPIGSLTRSEVTTLASALAAASNHVVSREIARYAVSAGLSGELAEDIHEEPGAGLRGRVEGHEIRLGSLTYAKPDAQAIGNRLQDGRSLHAFLSQDGTLVGKFVMSDKLRAGAVSAVAALKKDGVRHFSIISGDVEESVCAVAKSVGIEDRKWSVTPPAKLAHIRNVMTEQGTTAMVGDGINDAPALAAASVGIAIAPRTGDIAAETADIVLLDDNLMRLHEALFLSRRTLRIAKQSIVVGLTLSVIGMAVAAFGAMSPVVGALYQEAVDLAVIANALRAAARSNPA